jgi:hypothetical protein
MTYDRELLEKARAHERKTSEEALRAKRDPPFSEEEIQRMLYVGDKWWEIDSDETTTLQQKWALKMRVNSPNASDEEIARSVAENEPGLKALAESTARRRQMQVEEVLREEACLAQEARAKELQGIPNGAAGASSSASALTMDRKQYEAGLRASNSYTDQQKKMLLAAYDEMQNPGAKAAQDNLKAIGGLIALVLIVGVSYMIVRDAGHKSERPPTAHEIQTGDYREMAAKGCDSAWQKLGALGGAGKFDKAQFKQACSGRLESILAACAAKSVTPNDVLTCASPQYEDAVQAALTHAR